MKKPKSFKLTDIPNVGPAVEKDLHLLGITKFSQLRGRNPYKMYLDLCKKTCTRHDPCVLDVFMAVVDYAAGAPKTPWWFYTPERKKKYPDLKRVKIN
jgi:hypothetical protein